jgi:hypothetical protein
VSKHDHACNACVTTQSNIRRLQASQRESARSSTQDTLTRTQACSSHVAATNATPPPHRGQMGGGGGDSLLDLWAPRVMMIRSPSLLTTGTRRVARTVPQYTAWQPTPLGGIRQKCFRCAPLAFFRKALVTSTSPPPLVALIALACVCVRWTRGGEYHCLAACPDCSLAMVQLPK